LRKAFPVLADKTALDGRATAYACRSFACQAPVHTAEQLAAQLTKCPFVRGMRRDPQPVEIRRMPP